MTGRVVPLMSDLHTEVQVLLPWHAAGRLDADERAQVEAHVAACPRCQAELEAERKLLALHDEREAAGDVEGAWARMRRRIAEAPPARPRGRARRGWLAPPALRWLVAAQFTVIALLAAVLLVAPPLERYRGLGAPAPSPANGNVIVKFRPDTAERELRRVLNASGARFVDGPTTSDAYLLQVPSGGEAAALQRLRAEPAVLLAERLDGGSR